MPDVEGVAGQRDHDRVLLELAVLVEVSGDDAVLGVLTGGESGDAHTAEPIEAPPLRVVAAADVEELLEGVSPPYAAAVASGLPTKRRCQGSGE